MAMSLEELELQTVELLPAREVMSTAGRGHGHQKCCNSWEYNDNDNVDQDTVGGGFINVQALNNIAVLNFD